MKLRKYFSGLWKTLKNNLNEIIKITFLMWLLLPVFIFLIYTIYLILFGIEYEGIVSLINLAIKSIIDISLPWYISLVLTPWKTAIELIIIFLLVTHYYWLNS